MSVLNSPYQAAIRLENQCELPVMTQLYLTLFLELHIILHESENLCSVLAGFLDGSSAVYMTCLPAGAGYSSFTGTKHI